MVKAIVGANWGDEGKGKITDMLAEHSDVVIRFQGGANAGHTIINDYGRFALHILPSGIFYPHITNIIGNGVALDVKKLVDELNEKLRVAPAGGKPAPEKDKLWVPQPHFEKVSKDVEQVHITMGMPGYYFCDPRKYAMSIVCSALGGSMSSRLFQRVR